MPKVSIIILTYNSSGFIPSLIKSIQDSQKDYELIVVDNNSSDDTIEKVKKFQNVILKENKENVGFAKGINIGAKIAKGEYLLFINPDTVLKQGKLDDLLSVFNENKNAGIVGGKLIKDNGDAENSAGKFMLVPEILITSISMDEIMGIRFSPAKIKKVDFVSGGFMMVKKDLFDQLDGFDEKLFMYIEDMEFCFRANKAGYETYFTPSVVFSHASHGSSNRSFAIENIYKGLLYFHKKHSSPISFILVRYMLKSKAAILVMIGKIFNNKYLLDTYSKLLKI